MSKIYKHIDIYALIAGILIAIIFRVVLPFNNIMTNPIQFNSNDAYYFLRIADMYPNIPVHDQFLNFPDGQVLSSTTWGYVLALGSVWTGLTISQVGAFLPVLCGILTFIPVFFISRLLFKDRIITAFVMIILALMPGEFLARTQLGAADYHCAEILLVSTIMCLILYATHDKDKWFLYAFVGIPSVLYAAIWQGYLLVLFIIGVWCLVLLYGWINDWKINLSLTLAGLVGIGVLSIIYTDFAYTMFTRFADIFTWSMGSATDEEFPLFVTFGNIDPAPAWAYFGATFYLALAGLGLFVYRYKKEKRSVDLLFIIWTIVMILITLARRRFAYYSAINIALLSGYAVYILILFASKIKIGSVFKIHKRNAIFLTVVLLIAVLVPIGRGSIAVATTTANLMPQEWKEATQWLKEQPNGYYYTGNGANYGVVSWWDYGYWIVREGHQPVFSHPGGGQRILNAVILITDNEVIADNLMEGQHLKYLIIDWKMATNKLYSEIGHTHLLVSNYYEQYELNSKTGNLLYPAAYQMLITRLFYYDGKAVKAQGYPVIVADGKKVISVHDFQYLEAAEDYITLQSDKNINYFIAGTELGINPIDIDKVSNFSLVFTSSNKVLIDSKEYPALKIFEYKPK